MWFSRSMSAAPGVVVVELPRRRPAQQRAFRRAVLPAARPPPGPRSRLRRRPAGRSGPGSAIMPRIALHTRHRSSSPRRAISRGSGGRDREGGGFGRGPRQPRHARPAQGGSRGAARQPGWRARWRSHGRREARNAAHPLVGRRRSWGGDAVRRRGCGASAFLAGRRLTLWNILRALIGGSAGVAAVADEHERRAARAMAGGGVGTLRSTAVTLLSKSTQDRMLMA